MSLDFAARHPESFARILGRGAFDECELIIESLPAERVAAIVARLPAARIRQLLDSERHQPTRWLIDAPFDDAVTLLSRIPRERRIALVNSLDDRDRQRRLLRHLQYPAHSVGALVVDILLRLSAGSLAKDVVAELRELDIGSSDQIVIVDTDGHYLGVLDRWRLLLSSPPTGHVEDYLIAVKAVRPETPVAAVAQVDAWHTRNWLPVVDHRNRVLGAVSREKVFRTVGAHTGISPGRGYILLDLLTDLVFLCDAALLKVFSRNDAP